MEGKIFFLCVDSALFNIFYQVFVGQILNFGILTLTLSLLDGFRVYFHSEIYCATGERSVRVAALQPDCLGNFWCCQQLVTPQQERNST